MFVNIIKNYRNVVAVSDKELIGKKFEEGKMQLNVKENFYKGEEKTSEEVFDVLKNMKIEDATFNLVGERTINVAIKSGVIEKGQIGYVKGIPFALILM